MSGKSLNSEELTELVEFIRFSLKEGLSARQVEESLLESGQNEEQIRLAMEYSLNLKKMPKKDQPKNEPTVPELLFEEVDSGVSTKKGPLKTESPKLADFLKESQIKVELVEMPTRVARPSIDKMREQDLIHALKKSLREKVAYKKLERKRKFLQIQRWVLFLVLFLGWVFFKLRA